MDMKCLCTQDIINEIKKKSFLRKLHLGLRVFFLLELIERLGKSLGKIKLI